ncbi:MAG: DUF6580 family putative transport protein [Gemmataceae bacterium]
MQSSTVRVAFVLAIACATAAALRLGMWLPNVTAVGALALYCGSRLNPLVAWLPPLAVMAATDLLLERWFGLPPFNRAVYGCYVVNVLLGYFLVRRPAINRVLGVGLLGSVIFFVVTNFEVWRTSTDSAFLSYPKTWDGLVACYTAALPFFRYTLLGDLTFAVAFFTADYALARAVVPAPETE